MHFCRVTMHMNTFVLCYWGTGNGKGGCLNMDNFVFSSYLWERRFAIDTPLAMTRRSITLHQLALEVFWNMFYSNTELTN